MIIPIGPEGQVQTLMQVAYQFAILSCYKISILIVLTCT